MKAFLIIAGHIVVALLLFRVGISFNDIIKKYSENYTGLITLFSVAFGIYTTALNILYQRSPTFHLFIHRLLLKITRTHTYWQPHFDFTLDQEQVANPSLLIEVWEMLRQGRHGNAVKRDETPTTLSATLDNLFVLRLRLNDTSLCAFLDQKLRVPTHLYDTDRRRLTMLAEDLQRVTKSTMTRCSVRVSFPEGKRNPYYGFFINRLSPSLLQNFQVIFRLNAKSDCRIEAGIDHVNVEGTSFSEMFDGLSQVLTLQALPEGGSQ